MALLPRRRIVGREVGQPIQCQRHLLIRVLKGAQKHVVPGDAEPALGGFQVFDAAVDRVDLIEDGMRVLDERIIREEFIDGVAEAVAHDDGQ